MTSFLSAYEHDIYDPPAASSSSKGGASPGSTLHWRLVGSHLRAWTSARFPLKNGDRSNADGQIYTSSAKHEPLPLQKASPGRNPNFLSLPGELRNRIYELVIYPNHKNLFIAFQTSPHDIFRTFLKSHIYRTSRQIRAETFSFLCSKKSFRIINAVSAETFLRCVGPSGRQSLTSITFVLTQFVDMPARQENSFFRFVEEAKNLHHFCLEVDAHLTDKAADKSKWLFLARMEKAISTLDECTFTWCMIMRFVPDDNEWRLSEMFLRLEELLGAERRVGGRAFAADGTEIKK